MSRIRIDHVSREEYRRIITTFPVLAFAAIPVAVLAVVTGEADIPLVVTLAGLWIGAMLSVVAVVTYIFRRQDLILSRHAEMKDQIEPTDRIKLPWAIHTLLVGGIMVTAMIVTVLLYHFGLHVYLSILVGMVVIEMAQRKVARRFT